MIPVDELASPIDILLIEDSSVDIQLTEEALRDSNFSHRLHVVRDGEAALQFLRGEPPYAEAPRPELILLDLSLPKKNGREVLAELKADEALRSIPVCVISISGAEHDIAQAYALQANYYITKPFSADEYIAQIRALSNFWFTRAPLPPPSR